MNYYPFHLGDYAAHTAHLEPMEDLAYRRMLDLYYRSENPLPNDWRDIARLIRMKDQGEAIEAVLAEFFMLTDDGWTHDRCDAEIAKMHDKQTKARASAQAMLDKRSANAQRTLSERSADAQLPTPTPTPTPTANAVGPRSPKGSRLAADWVLPKAWGEWAMAHQPTWTADHCRGIAANFADFWQSKAGKDATKLDWEKTWHTWVRKEGPMKPSAGSATGPQSVPIAKAIDQTRDLLQTEYLRDPTPEEKEAAAVKAREIRERMAPALKVIRS